MTNVVIHGILGKKFGTSIKLKVGNFKFLVLAIDSIKNGFREEMMKLSKNGMNYEIIFNQNQVDIVPSIIGSGNTFYKIFGIILQVIGAILMFTPFWPIGMALSASGAALYGYGSKLEAIQKMEEMFAKMAEQQKGKAAGGGTKLTGGQGKSYAFGVDLNLSSQGSMVSIGYGKMKLGSNVIAVSMKHNPTNIDFEQNAISVSNNVLSLYD
jgi:predicted phage tail protein